MANAYTDILSGASLGVNLVQTAYDKLVEFALRAYPVMRAIADKRVADQTAPGSSVVFDLYQDLSQATSTLAETTDPDSVAVPQTNTVTVTLAEYGNAVLSTRKLRTFAFTDIDPAIADLIAFNMVDSLDAVVRDVLRAGTNVTREAGGNMTFNTGTAANVTATDIIKSRDVRAAVAKLRGRKTMPQNGPSYLTLIHPDVSYDLRSESGTSATWRTPHEQSGPVPIWAGQIGEYEGSVFVETPRTYQATDGAAAAKVHRTVMVGKQALAEVVAQEPGVIVGPVTDKLRRLTPIGWYAIAGWARYREEAIQRIETSSSI